MSTSKIIVVFHSDDCSHCKEYIPRFRRVALQYRTRISIKSVKVAASNFKLLDRYKIRAFPTTCVLDAGEEVLKRREGAITDAAIVKLFEWACS